MSIAPLLFKLVVRPPFRRIEDHMEVATKCALQVEAFFRASQAGQWQDAEQVFQSIKTMEADADALKHKVRIKLHKNLFLSVARHDLLSLLSTQDNLANQARDVTGLILGRKMVFPEALQDLLDRYITNVMNTIEQARKTVGELGDLQESAFGGNVIHFAEEMIRRLDRMETKTDVDQVDIRIALQAIEKEYHPVDVIFWYDAIKQLGTLADWAQRIGAKLLQILAH